ncbi:NAD-dependent epimerase/dehydratase family protein [Thalassotalea castellviae]|uniref:UDP-glucose 4-epimerase n=1 Tax=Thalassotalea castellviae TaxID=3075612 RepID=A0ABU3A176_9GAMM|nr:NAD-dependent epimerase/dehydratase family protein [Thalassotalea sp. W431]MDT0603925.1 NAD-dependent epimerase/dehydratase family protein [Thalassotalea sp. W431]
MERRNFIKSVGAISTLSLSPTVFTKTVNLSKKGKILILGGTKFIGPVIVEQLIEAGYEVTLFNRGLTNPHLFPNIEKLRGDRYPANGKGLTALKTSRKWDVIIDTWAENPLCVKDTLSLLQNRCKQYIYTSSMAVYPDQLLSTQSGITEKAKLPTDNIPTNYNDSLNYGLNKRIADKLVNHSSKGCVLRPHSICGIALDNISDNQRYWPVRLQRGGEIAAPGDGGDTTQYIDVKDLAAFILTCIEKRYIGTYNTFTTERFDAYLYGLKSLSSNRSELSWLSHEYLYKNNIRHYVDMPMWAARQVVKGTFTISSEKAIQAGLTFRPLSHTFSDVLAGFYQHESNRYEFGVGESKSGLSRQREQQLLTHYQA